MNYLIVGASSGLGRDLAYIFAKNSHNLTLISRDKRDTQALKTDIENKFNSKVVTLTWKFNIFYPAEEYHQDYYQKNFLRYLSYKKSCQREEILKKIWN